MMDHQSFAVVPSAVVVACAKAKIEQIKERRKLELEQRIKAIEGKRKFFAPWKRYSRAEAEAMAGGIEEMLYGSQEWTCEDLIRIASHSGTVNLTAHDARMIELR